MPVCGGDRNNDRDGRERCGCGHVEGKSLPLSADPATLCMCIPSTLKYLTAIREYSDCCARSGKMADSATMERDKPPPRSILQKAVTLRRRGSNTHLLSAVTEVDERPSVGVCFSGGGMRSGMFCSGVLRGLLTEKKRIDYLSTVSGGGFIASSYMDWKCREGGMDDPEWHRRYFEQMIENVPNAALSFDRSTLGGVWDLIVRSMTGVFNVVFMTMLTLYPVLQLVAELFTLSFGPTITAFFNERPSAELGSSIYSSALAIGVAECLALLSYFTHNPQRPTILKHTVTYALLGVAGCLHVTALVSLCKRSVYCSISYIVSHTGNEMINVIRSL